MWPSKCSSRVSAAIAIAWHDSARGTCVGVAQPPRHWRPLRYRGSRRADGSRPGTGRGSDPREPSRTRPSSRCGSSSQSSPTTALRQFYRIDLLFTWPCRPCATRSGRSRKDVFERASGVELICGIAGVTGELRDGRQTQRSQRSRSFMSLPVPPRCVPRGRTPWRTT